MKKIAGEEGRANGETERRSRIEENEGNYLYNTLTFNLEISWATITHLLEMPKKLYNYHEL